MFTLLAISNFFDDFLNTFSDYNFIDKYIYSPEMDFSKLKPYVLDTFDTEERQKVWLGIIFVHSQKRRGDTYYQSGYIEGDLEEADGVSFKQRYLCSQASTDLSFNIVSNDIYTLEALENEIDYFYNELKGYPCPLPKLENYQAFANKFIVGELTKYDSKIYGELCSLGVACTLNYPILLKGDTIKIIKQINLLIGKKIKGLPDDYIYYQSNIK